MTKKNKLYVIFAVISTVFAVLTTVLISFFALNSPDSLESFPSYTYSQYVDRSQDEKADSTYGAQLYEAEDFDLFGQAQVLEYISASGSQVVSSITKGSSLSYSLIADKSAIYKFQASVSLLSDTNKRIEANSLFSLSLNSDHKNLSGISIAPSYNTYDFIENDICTLKLKEGKNTIEIVSSSNTEFTFDYFVLTPNYDRTTSVSLKTVNSKYSESFNANEGKQEFPSEKMEQNGALVIKDSEAGSTFSTYFSEKGNSSTCHLFSSTQTSTQLSIRIKKSAKESESVQLKITLNGNMVFDNHLRDVTVSYTEINIGNISIQRDENILSIENKGGIFYLDSFYLNSNINYSSKRDNCRFEAEDATLNGPKIVNNSLASAGAYVTNNYRYSYVQFELESVLEDNPRLAITLGYRGNTTALSSILSLKVNSTVVFINTVELKESDSLENFVDLPIGKISLRSGLNVIQVTSLTNQYSLDCLTLFHNEVGSNYRLFQSEAENLISDTKQQIRFNKNASKKQSSFLENNDSLLLFFYSDTSGIFTLSANICLYQKSQSSQNPKIQIQMNRSQVSLYLGELPSSSPDNVFTKINLGNYTLQKGLNSVKISTISCEVYFDYLIVSL